MSVKPEIRNFPPILPGIVFALTSLFVLPLFLPLTSVASDEEPPSVKIESLTNTETGPSGSAVGLDKLLKLPKEGSTKVVTEPKTARADWESRFTTADEEVEEAKRNLKATQNKVDALTEASGGGWKMTPPGMEAGDTGTVSYELKQEVRDNKEAVSAAERHRTDLMVEASLAGVPSEWIPEKPAVKAD
jgi:hypothetical protein